ncbi:hypothetical protein AArcMg_0228 [Natrarchaeobaculum sulfurireducens]|uniref:Uncharacterized protein n=1 Tax=Natrarchaeobaculum sulfurireducens TaxID=2044521 RepID=A0A346PL56_9EURY|nr:hypothetical protein AArcMg_0228 [Natrarchaeobaculum sulfurireducens]
MSTVLRKRLLRRGPTEPPGFDPATIPGQPTDRTLTIDGDEFHCRTVTSPDGEWTLAFGQRADRATSRAFRIRNDRVVDWWSVSRPTHGAIANDGTVALVSGTGPSDVGGSLEVFDGEEVHLERQFNATTGLPAIRADGSFVAVSTRPPASTVTLFDVGANRAVAAQTVPRRTPRVLGFHGDGKYLYVGIRRNDDPYLALDTTGTVLWGSDRFRASRPLRARLESLTEQLRS